MGACIANPRHAKLISPFNRPTQMPNTNILISKEQSMLLDMWNQKHIEILKAKFQKGISKKRNANSLNYTEFLNVFDHTMKEGFEKGRSILQNFGATICKQAFKLFDSSRMGSIIFRDFCCALSIICLGSSNEKLRFLFDLFDLDRDGYLTKKEQAYMLQQLINILITSDTKTSLKLKAQWVEIQLAEMTGEVWDYSQFKTWAENSIDVYKILADFELVPSPHREHQIINQILETHQQRHGDTIYALSFYWWDSWKEYTEQHTSTIEVQQFVGKVRESIAKHTQMPSELKLLLLNQENAAVQTMNGSQEKNERDDQPVKAEQEQDLGLSFSMKQQMALQSRRTSAVQNAILMPTPRRAFGIKMSHSNLSEVQFLQDQDIDVSAQKLNKSNNNHPSKVQRVNTKLEEIWETKKKKTKLRQSMTVTNKHQHQSVVEFKRDTDTESNGEDIVKDKDLVFTLKDNQQLIQPNSKINKINNKLKSLARNVPSSVNSSHMDLNQQNSVDSFLKFEDTNIRKFQPNFSNRPLAIDNSDIEGEHPGQLQPNLIMYRDFVTIPEQAWNQFCTWYGIQDQSPVFARKVLMHNSITSMELYPPRISCMLSDRDGKPIADSQKSLFVSTSLTIGEVHLKICELFNYISTRDTRLWVKGGIVEGDNQWTLVSPETHTVKDGDVFMVEVKFFGNQWPMEMKTGRTRSWQQFEIGDKLDVKDGEIWKVGCIDKVNKDSLKIHLLNENWKNDITIRKTSELLAQFGQHTMNLHFTSTDQQQVQVMVPGIRNIGNTCYMNACLQTLLHTPLYSDYFTTQAFQFYIASKQSQDLLSEGFSFLVEQMKSQVNVIDPNEFKKLVNTSLPLFYGNQQQDAAEFFNFMLDKLNEEMNRAEKQKSLQITDVKPEINLAVESQHSLDVGEIGGTNGEKVNSSQTANQDFEKQKQLESSPKQEQVPNNQDDQAMQTIKSNQVQTDEESQLKKYKNQQLAISEAKQTVYNEFFQPTSIFVIRNRSNIQVTNPEEFIMPDSFNPNISELEAKSRSAWFKSLKHQNSPISDLFVGQQTTEVTCLKCSNKSHTFENFYSLPIPLPANLKTSFYISIIRWQKQIKQLTPIVTYGVQINKYQTLKHLVDEIQKLVTFGDSQFNICEMVGQRIYRVLEDLMIPLYLIAKRTNQLYFYECCTEPKPRIITASQGGRISRQIRPNNTWFNSFEEIIPGMLVEAQDQNDKWYVALVIDKEQGTQTTPSRISVHFYQMHSKFDEFIEESVENLKRIRPIGASGQAEQPKNLLLKMIMVHRRIHVDSQVETRNIIGMPYCIMLPNWLTWNELYKQISLQVFRHLKQTDSDQPEENIQPDENSQGNSVQQIRQKSVRQANVLNFKQNNTPKLLNPIHQKFVQITVENQSVLDDMDQYFEIKIFCAETHKCVFCLLKLILKQDHQVCSKGCKVLKNDEQIKYILSMFKKIEIVIDWNQKSNGECFYQDAAIDYDISYQKLKKQESEVISGIPLGACLDLYGKKEQIEGYQCDFCKVQTNAVIKPLLSHLPDVLVLHLKRFNFESGYLDKIEDLVTFPLRNLDMQKYLIQGNTKNATYDLYAIINHHMYQTGGHYTAYVQIKTDNEPIWVHTNDQTVTLVAGQPSELVKKDAYMLFYKRKELTASNILKLTHQV